MTITFDNIEETLKGFLDFFEEVEYHNTGVHYISGGFAHADYDELVEDEVFFTLKWGVQSDCEDRVNTEHFKISVENLLNAELSMADKYRLTEDA